MKTGARFNFPSDATPARSVGGWILGRKQGPDLISHQMLPLHKVWADGYYWYHYIFIQRGVVAGGPMLIICRHSALDIYIC